MYAMTTTIHLIFISINLHLIIYFFNTNFLPRVNGQLPNIYDLTWFESFSIQNYDRFWKDSERNVEANRDEKKTLEYGNNEIFSYEDLVSSEKTPNTFSKTKEDNIESADVSSEESSHFDSHSVQQSNRSWMNHFGHFSMKNICTPIIYTFNYLFIFFYCFPYSIFNVTAVC